MYMPIVTKKMANCIIYDFAVLNMCKPDDNHCRNNLHFINEHPTCNNTSVTQKVRS